MTLIIHRQDEQKFQDWLATEWGFFCGLGKLDGDPIALESYQLRFLQDRSRLRWITKSRQVGYSFIFALEALARCHLKPKHTAIFVSYNQADAKEKILIARQLYEELPLAFQKKLVVDSRSELAFESNAPGKPLSRIVSHPSKAPRGKTGDVYLDELAHYTNDQEVYRGSTALTLRAQGQLTGCSTPLGQRGVFWEIATQTLRPYPHHRRETVPWWLCRFFSKDPAEAERLAPDCDTATRVERWATSSLFEQFESLPLDDFQQEFEATFVGEAQSFYPYAWILACTHDDLEVTDQIDQVPPPQGRLVAGFDVGRVRDFSELAVFEEVDDRMVCRLLRRFERTPFAEQEDALRHLLTTLPVVRLSIDRSGLGMHLSENLSRDFPQVRGEAFTQPAKERWAIDFKLRLQKRTVCLPKDRGLVTQIHSIHRRVLPSGKISFDAQRDAHGHADRFWAIALACQLDRPTARPAEVAVRVIG